jgi:hypothetical protein
MSSKDTQMKPGANISQVVILFISALAFSLAAAQDSDTEALAKAAQNPISSLISVPFQWNSNFDVGPLDKPQHVLNIQPVYPLSLNDDWNLITRTILPFISQPSFGQGQSRESGLGDIQFSAFFSPTKPTSGGWIWGAGPILQLNTAGDDRLGQGAWGLGPAAVALKIAGPWVVGGLLNNVWSLSEDTGRADVNQLLFQPFINYNFADHPGRYLTFAPVITANWEATSDKWIVPLGIGMGQITKFGKQPVNLQASFYYNVERPDQAPRYQVRLQIQLMFPK